MNIKKIALKVAEEQFPHLPEEVMDYAEALVAEIQRRGEPVYQIRAEAQNWMDCTSEYYELWQGEKRILFTFPPDKAQIEQRVAEACAAVALERRSYRASMNTINALDDVAEVILNGEWRKFMKGE